jgi:outer membrane receptor protein involved in Fe transport
MYEHINLWLIRRRFILQPIPMKFLVVTPTRFTASLLLAVGLTTPLWSQRANPSSNSPGTREETVQLTPFTVSAERDEGYAASDVISAGRLSTNLLRTPADITVLTREFLDDIGALNMDAAAVWLTSSSVTIPTDRDFGTNMTFRGLPSGANTRNYFPYDNSIDSYVVDRLEGSRGPNSILYGDAQMGGQANVITKRAKFRNFVNVDARFDTDGGRYATVDLNRQIGNRLALRVNALFQEDRSWMQGFFDDRANAAIAATYVPWKGGELRFDGELGHRNTADRVRAFTDQSSLWDQTTSISAPLTANPATSTGISRITSQTLVFSNAWDGSIMNFVNWGRSIGTTLTLLSGEVRPFANFPTIPRKSFRVAPTQKALKTELGTGSLFFEQVISPRLVVELAAYKTYVDRAGDAFSTYATAYREVNRFLPDGRPNPYFGDYYSENQAFNNDTTNNTATGWRVATAYVFETPNLKQTLSAVAQVRDTVFEVVLPRLGRSNGSIVSISNGNNLIRSRHYWTQSDQEEHFPPTTGGYEVAYAITRDTLVKQRLRSLQLNTVGEYFGNRLTALAGVRFDRFNGTDREIGTFDARGNPATYTLDATTGDATTSSFGIVWFPIASVGLYANYSEGFLPTIPRYPQLNGSTAINLTTSNSKSVGLRTNVAQGKLVGSIGYYESDEFKRPQSVSTSQINQMWADLNMLNRQILGTSSANYIDSFDAKGRGWEADLTANVSQALRLKVNVAFPQTLQVNALPESKAYYDANVALWQAGANNPANANRARIATNLATYANTIATAADGRPLNGTYKWRANMFGTYKFDSGWKKGLRVGGGVNLFGRQLIGSPTNDPFTLIYMDRYATATAFVGYGFKAFRRVVELQLNVSNLFDYNDPVYTNVLVYSGATYRNGYFYVDPRKATLSCKLTF